MRADIAKAIKDSVAMSDIAELYGIDVSRAGFACCPFHSEKTASLKIYREAGRGWHCFGCGRGGSVIDFVMELFNINFSAAIVRINSDLRLGLCQDKPDMRHIAQIRQQEAEKQAELNRYRETYLEKESLFKGLWKARKELAPKSLDEMPQPLFVQSLHELDKLEYWFEINRWR